MKNKEYIVGECFYCAFVCFVYVRTYCDILWLVSSLCSCFVCYYRNGVGF
jgi:hypothetical protein